MYACMHVCIQHACMHVGIQLLILGTSSVVCVARVVFHLRVHMFEFKQVARPRVVVVEHCGTLRWFILRYVIARVMGLCKGVNLHVRKKCRGAPLPTHPTFDFLGTSNVHASVQYASLLPFTQRSCSPSLLHMSERTHEHSSVYVCLHRFRSHSSVPICLYMRQPKSSGLPLHSQVVSLSRHGTVSGRPGAGRSRQLFARCEACSRG